MTIGDFSRATHFSVKTLRHYHRIGLLIPAEVDADTGYRYYTAGQIPTAQIIRRFRALDMPLDQIDAVISTPDVADRDRLITAHLQRLQTQLATTQAAVAALTDLLTAPSVTADIRHRSVGSTAAAAISEVVDVAEVAAWWQGALGELEAGLRAQGAAPGTAGGIFATELFTHERGRATVFVAVDQPISTVGRINQQTIPAIELATILHEGPPAGIDRAYGALAAYVTTHALGIDGPLREYYLVGPTDTNDQTQWRTEIGWPIFRTHTDDAVEP